MGYAYTKNGLINQWRAVNSAADITASEVYLDQIPDNPIWDGTQVRTKNAGELLTVAREMRIATINAECRARLLARYGPAEEQVSRAIGVYGATEQAALATGVAATIDASNTASNAVLAAADIAAVEAVSVSWPAI